MTKELFSAEQKHYILTQYSPRDRSRSFSAVASRFGVPGGKSTVQRWYKQWNGNMESLKHKKGQGRPSILNRNERTRLIIQPILRKNRAHTPVHYSDLLQSVQQKSGKKVALRTIQAYGNKHGGIKQKRTKKKTADERECLII
jgi:transposase